MVAGATLDDLDPNAIKAVKKRFAEYLIKNEPETSRHEKIRSDVQSWDVPTLLNKAHITKQGRLTRSALLLLEEWTNVYTYRKNEVCNYYSLKSIPEIESDIAKLCRDKGIEYALTDFSGAARYAPAVRYTRAMAYIYNTREDVASLLNLKEVESGANITLLGPYDEGVFYGTQIIEDIRIVTPLQVYLDLKGYKGRGEEAAEVLLRDVIKPKWTAINK